MNSKRITTIWVALTVTALAVGLALSTAERANGAESHRLTTARDRIAENRCHRQGPPRQFCKAMVTAARREHVARRWAYSRSMIELVHHESGWRRCAVNGYKHEACWYKGNKACGYFQRNPCPWHPVGSATPLTQCRSGIRYILHRYHSPDAALSHWKRFGWY